MKTSIATVSLSGTLSEKLDAIAAAKFDGVEIFENDLITFNGTPSEVRSRVEQLGLDIVTLQPFRDFEGMPDNHRARVFARSGTQVRYHGGAWLQPPDDLQQCRR